MKTFDFIQVTISHNLKDPHSKALEPDCLSPLLTVATQSLVGEGLGGIIFMVRACLPVGMGDEPLMQNLLEIF